MKRSDLLKITPPAVHIPGRHEVEEDFEYTVLARTVPGELGRRVYDEQGGVTVPDDGEPMLLVLWLYDGQRELRYSVYCSALERDFRSWDHLKGAWREATLYNLCFFTAWRAKKFRYADAESAMLGSFFRSDDPDTLRSCYEWQMSQRKRVMTEKILKSQREIDALMSEAEPLPADIDRWIDNHVLEKSRYIYYEKRGRVMHGYCTHCRQRFEVTEYPSGRLIDKLWKCPLCHSRVMIKSPNCSATVHDRGEFQIVQRITGGVLVTVWAVNRVYRRGKAAYSGYEQNVQAVRRVYLGMGGMVRSYIYEWKRDYLGRRMCWQDVTAIGQWGGWHSMVYPRNLKHLLEDTPWRHTALYEMARSGGPMDAAKWMIEARNKPAYEKCAKLGLYRLAAGEMFGHEYRRVLSGAGNQPLHRSLAINRAELRMLCRLNADSGEVDLLRKLKVLGRVADIEGLRALRRAGISAGWLAEGRRERLLSAVTLYRIARYVTAQKKHYPKGRHADAIAGDWADYLGECAELGYDLRSNSVVMPADLRESHVRTSMLVRHKHNAELDAKIAARCERLAELYAWEDSGYLVRMAASTGELIEEGARQSICVGGYGDKYASGGSTILFVRKADAPDESFVTAEVVERKTGVDVIQVRAYRNGKPDDDTMKFWGAYKKRVLDKLGSKPWEAEHAPTGAEAAAGT